MICRSSPPFHSLPHPIQAPHTSTHPHPVIITAPGDDELRIYRKILTSPVVMPSHFSPAACDLLGQLLNKDPTARLGAGPLGMTTLKAHPWFQAINWDALMEHR